ncbi:MAG: hypothetical protein U0R68_08130 [Candidatus Nanopelagicales bacterium]
MRKTAAAVTALGATAVLSLGLAAPASAGGGVTTPVSIASADFGWDTARHTSYTRIEVATSADGDGLSVSQIATDLDRLGNPTRMVITTGFVTSGFRARIDTRRFRGAWVVDVSVPVQRCVYLSDYDPGTCTDGRPVVVHLRWTGTGPITTDVSGPLDDPYTIVTTSRDARACGRVTGLPDRLGAPATASILLESPPTAA